MPTLAGFQAFITNVMGITSAQLPPNSPVIAYALALAQAIIPTQMQCAPGDIYSLAVYNLAGDRLINYAQDTPPSTFFQVQRLAMGINKGFVSGVLESTSDNGSGSSFAVSDALKALTIGQLQYLRTPWGTTALGFMQDMGLIWGVS